MSGRADPACFDIPRPMIPLFETTNSCQKKKGIIHTGRYLVCRHMQRDTSDFSPTIYVTRGHREQSNCQQAPFMFARLGNS